MAYTTPNTTPSLSTRIRRDKPLPLGILSVLADDDKRRILRNPSLLHQKLPSSSSFAPTLKLECSFATPPAVRRYSAPIDIPSGASRMHGDENAEEDEAAMVPPHQIVARRWAEGPSCTGRTLKGRDLRRVRDAVWRQIGFED